RPQRAPPRGRAQPSRARRHSRLAVALDEPPLLARVRPERDQRPEEKDDAGEPDQVDERLDEHLEVDGAVRVDLVGDPERILRARPVRADPDLPRARLLGELAVAARAEAAQVLAAAGRAAA